MQSFLPVPTTKTTTPNPPSIHHHVLPRNIIYCQLPKGCIAVLSWRPLQSPSSSPSFTFIINILLLIPLHKLKFPCPPPFPLIITLNYKGKHKSTRPRTCFESVLDPSASPLPPAPPAPSFRSKRSNLKLFDRYSSLSSRLLRVRHNRRVNKLPPPPTAPPLLLDLGLVCVLFVRGHWQSVC